MATSKAGALKGQFVRLDLPGDNSKFPRWPADGDKKTINLAECQVFQGDQNIALRKRARQSSSFSDQFAERAVDGSTAGNYGNLAHSGIEDMPWWEVDLGSEQAIDRMVIWNRSDGEVYKRMNHFRVRVLDHSRQVVFERVVDKAPNPSIEIVRPVLLAESGPESPAGDNQPLVLRLPLGGLPRSPAHLRISVATSLPNDGAARQDAMQITDVATRLATAYALSGETAQATRWFDKSLEAAQTGEATRAVAEQLEGFEKVLAALLKSRPKDAYLQLALARTHARRGREELDLNRPAEALAELAQAREQFAELGGRYPAPHWTVLKPVEMKSQGGATLTLKDDGSILASGTNPARDHYTLVAKTDLARITAIRLEALTDPSLPKNGPGRDASGNFHLNELQVFSAGVPIALTDIVVAYDQWELRQSRNVIDGKLDSMIGWSNSPKAGEKNVAFIATRLERAPSDELKIEMHFSRGQWTQHNLGSFRLAVTGDPNPLVKDPLLLDRKADELADLDVAIAKAQARQGQVNEAAAALASAFDRIEQRDDQKRFIEQLKGIDDALLELAKLRPRDPDLQLALARPHAERGYELLAQGRGAEALVELEQARTIFSRLLAEHPEPTWTVLRPIEIKSQGGATLTRQADDSILASGESPPRDVYSLRFSDLPATLRGLRFEVLPHHSLPREGPGRAIDGNLVLTEITATLKPAPPGPEQFLQLKNAVTTHEQLNPGLPAGKFAVAAAIDNDDKSTSDGWALFPKVGQAHRAVFEVNGDVQTGPGSTLTISLAQNFSGVTIGRCRVSVTSEPHAGQTQQLRHDLTAGGLTDVEIALGNAHAQEAQVDVAATAFGRAIDLAHDRAAVENIVRVASAHAGVLEKLSKKRAADSRLRLTTRR